MGIATRPSTDFSFTVAALAQIECIRNAQAEHRPNDPPVLACLAFGGPGTIENPPKDVYPTIGFWGTSEVSAKAWEEEDIEIVSGLHVIVAVSPERRAAMRGMVIDFAPERAFFLRGP